MAKISSIRKGSVQWNEEDRLQLATLLIKCGKNWKKACCRERECEECSAGILC